MPTQTLIAVSVPKFLRPFLVDIRENYDRESWMEEYGHPGPVAESAADVYESGWIARLVGDCESLELSWYAVNELLRVTNELSKLCWFKATHKKQVREMFRAIEGK